MSDYYGVDTSYRNAANETDVPKWSDEEKKLLGITDDAPVHDGTDAFTGVESYVEPDVQEEQVKQFEESKKDEAAEADAAYDSKIEKASGTEEEDVDKGEELKAGPTPTSIPSNVPPAGLTPPSK